MDNQVYSNLCHEQALLTYHRFPRDYTIPELNNGAGIGGIPVLRIGLWTLRQTSSQRVADEGELAPDDLTEKKFVGFKTMLPELFRFMSTSSTIAQIRVVLQLGRLAILDDRVTLLDLVRDARGFGEAVIEYPQSRRTANKLASQMAMPIKTIGFALGGITHHVSRFKKYIRACQYDAATFARDDAQHFSRWVHGCVLGKIPNVSEEDLAKVSKKLRGMGTYMLWACISLKIDSRKFWQARRDIDSLWKSLPRQGPSLPEGKARGHYCLGRLSLAEGNGNGALWAFLGALCEYPGHKRVDEETDILEARVQGSNDLEDCIIRYNIETVLGEVRLQIQGSLRLNESRVLDLRDSFLGTA